MSTVRSRLTAGVMTALAIATGFATLGSLPAQAASHREAPQIAQDPAADITDVYAFVNWNDPNKVVFIMNVLPSQEPSSGPNYFFFDPAVQYAINLDLNRDGKAEDLLFEFRFNTEFRNATAGLGLNSPVANVGRPELGQITSLDGQGSAGLGIRQSYTVTMVRKNADGTRTRIPLGAADGKPLFAVPSNQGPFTMLNYENLAAQGLRTLANGVRVFAGQRDETFYIDLGGVFDGPLNLRRSPVLSNAEDADDTRNFGGVDTFSGFNVNTIAIEVPRSLVTPSLGTQIGMYASTARQKISVLREDKTALLTGPFIQVSRMGNPLVNELIIHFNDKDKWNATEPEEEYRFLADYQNPTLATVLNALYGVPIPAAPRGDLVSALLQYSGSNKGVLSELLRLDLSVLPTAAAQQKRLGILAHDAAGNPTPDYAAWPNGRRPNDDVTDIALRVVSGVLLGTGNARLGDGVNYNVGAPGTGNTANGIRIDFPFLPTPHDGRNRRHVDPGE